ncbi:MAG: MerC domain-containing protein [Parashewanella sp.]
MSKFRLISDKVSITLSLLCACHCLFLPFLLIAYPPLIALPMGEEAFHLWLLVAIVPLSSLALYKGYKTHNNKAVPIFGLFGLLILVLTGLLAHDFHLEHLEKAFTLIGAIIVAASHLVNAKKCNCDSNHSCTVTEHSL